MLMRVFDAVEPTDSPPNRIVKSAAHSGPEGTELIAPDSARPLIKSQSLWISSLHISILGSCPSSDQLLVSHKYVNRSNTFIAKIIGSGAAENPESQL